MSAPHADCLAAKRPCGARCTANRVRHAVLVTGSRDWEDRAAIRDVLATYPRGTLIVHGGAPGADRIAGSLSGSLHMFEGVVFAPWSWAGKKAGPWRNEVLALTMSGYAAMSFTVACEAFPGAESSGTWDMVERCEKHSIRWRAHGPWRDMRPAKGDR